MLRMPPATLVWLVVVLRCRSLLASLGAIQELEPREVGVVNIFYQCFRRLTPLIISNS